MSDNINEELWNAAKKGDIDKVRKYIKEGANVNYSDSCGWSVLVRAATSGHSEIVKILVTAGANLEQKRQDGSTALTEAAQQGHSDVVKILVTAGAKIEHQVQGCTALTWASDRGHIDIVKILVTAGAELDYKSKYGYSALTLASYKGHSEIVKFLVSKGAKLEHKDSYGFTALNLAAQKGHTDIVEILVTAGAKLEHEDTFGFTALTWAADKGHSDIVKILLTAGAKLEQENGRGSKALTLAAQKGHNDIVKILVTAGAEFEQKNIDLSEALTEAADRGHTDVVKFLVTAGAKLEHKNDNGFTALTVVAVKGHSDIVKILVTAGAKLEHQTEYGFTALTWASQKGHSDIVKILVTAGAELDHQTEYGSTALTEASNEGHSDIVKILVTAGAKLEHKDDNGFTALTLAAKKGHSDIMKFLLSIGADKFTKNNAGQTPVDVATKSETLFDDYHETGDDKVDKLLIRAVREKNFNIAVILISQGASINKLDIKSQQNLLYSAASLGVVSVTQNALLKGAQINSKFEKNQTALHIASQYENTEIVKFLLSVGADKFIKNDNGQCPEEVSKDSDTKSLFSEYSDDIDRLLARAIEVKNVNIVNILFMRGANVENLHEDQFQDLLTIQEKYGYAALNLAIENGSEDLLLNTLKVKNKSKLRTIKFKNIVALLGDIIEHGNAMMQEREEILDLLVKIDKSRCKLKWRGYDLESSQYRVTKQLKNDLPTSLGLKECITSTKERYPWSKKKLWFMRGLGILKNIILGLGLYFMDFSTDIIFSIDMFNNAGRNFTNEQKNCTEDLYSQLNKTAIICQEVWREDIGAEDCNNFMRQAEKQRHTCFETGARFMNILMNGSWQELGQ